MYWQDEGSEEQFVVPDRIVDLMFRIACPTLPVDHGWALSKAVARVLPWFSDESQAGLHIIHGADSGNGWERPQLADDLLYLSRRTRLTLRLPKQRAGDAGALIGNRLEIAGHEMEIQAMKLRLLSITDILYSRYVVADPNADEEAFLGWAADELHSMGIGFKRILPGKPSRLAGPEGALFTRSLMVAGMSYGDAVRLQEQGMGSGRTLGCGLFIPQKSF